MLLVSALAQSMARLPLPPKLPRLEPLADASALQLLEKAAHLSPLPPPVLATWGRLALVRFYNAHQDLKQDLLKKRTRGVCTIRFRQHCERISQRVRQIHKETDWCNCPCLNSNASADTSLWRPLWASWWSTVRRGPAFTYAVWVTWSIAGCALRATICEITPVKPSASC